MAEVCSRYPTAGGLYFWAGRLARKNKRVWAWYVGWFNFLGEVAVTAAIDYGAAVTWMALLSLVTGIEVTAGLDVRGLPRASSCCTGCSTPSASTSSSCCPTSAPGGTSWASRSSSAVLAFVPGPAPVACRGRSSTSRNETGWTRRVYVFLIGLLMAQYTYTGYDASAHVAEETKNASDARRPGHRDAACWVSIIAGWVLLVSITAADPGLRRLSARGTDTGLPPAQIFLDAAGQPDVGEVPAVHRLPWRSSSAAWPR